MGKPLLAAACVWLLCAAGCDGTYRACEPDPLRTGITIEWSGIPVDRTDCQILRFTEEYGEPDAMIFQAIIYVESRFQFDAVGCTVYNFEYDTAVVEAYNEHATASGWPAHPYVTP